MDPAPSTHPEGETLRTIQPDEQIFEAIYQNARIARATRIKVTTKADDNGGTTVEVTNDGRGAPSADPFVKRVLYPSA